MVRISALVDLDSIAQVDDGLRMVDACSRDATDDNARWSNWARNSDRSAANIAIAQSRKGLRLKQEIQTMA